MNIFFDVLHLYYLPQYLPVAKKLRDLGWQCCLVMYRDQDNLERKKTAVVETNLSVKWVENETESLALYQQQKPDWIVFGNQYDAIMSLSDNSKTALMMHGVGPKACYYSVSNCATTVRFVEGSYRQQRLQSMFPEQSFIDVGYAKLDPLVNGEYNHLKPSRWGLDDNKKSILFAPTYYPSSIECFSDNFAQEFSDFNIFLKPHFFSLVNKNFRNHKKKLLRWAQAKNVYLASLDDVNILPFMQVADLLISDASSTLFEFSALDKPVVWCDFYKLRWTNRGIFNFRFDKRMDEDLYKYADISVHAKKYRDLRSTVDIQLAQPDMYKLQRNKHTESLVGKVDGQCSERIANYLQANP